MNLSDLIAITCIVCAVIFYLHVAALSGVALWVRICNALPVPAFLAAFASVFVTGRIIDLITEILFACLAAGPVTLLADRHIKLRNTHEGAELLYRLRYWFVAVGFAIALIVAQVKFGHGPEKPVVTSPAMKKAESTLDSLNRLKRNEKTPDNPDAATR